jgi:hypothetical protein
MTSRGTSSEPAPITTGTYDVAGDVIRTGPYNDRDV